MRARAILIALPLLAAACGPQMPHEPETGPAIRNVVAKPIEPKPLDLKVKLPVVTRPVEEVELRAAAPGKIVWLPYDKGDKIEASKVPEATWQSVEQFTGAAPEGKVPTDEEVGLRNMAHLKDVPCFARIDDNALTQTFRETQANYDQAVRDLKRLEEYKETTGSQLDQARTRRDMARAAALRVLSQIEDTRICSPVTGVVTERMRQQGEYVNAGELMARVAVMSSIRADLELPEAHYSALNVGDSVEVTLSALTDDSGKALVKQGRVARKDTLAHPQTHSFTVEIDIDNQDLALPAGTFGTVQVTTYKRDEAMVVPLSAIKLNGDEKSLFVLKGNSTVREVKNIQIGQLTQEWAEILGDSIKPGERVVTTGAQWLSDNDTVSAVEKDPTA
jgi:RND family efflux transporter MFP subunit